jgi:tetratricopeptide (TPR) repeat protein
MKLLRIRYVFSSILISLGCIIYSSLWWYEHLKNDAQQASIQPSIVQPNDDSLGHAVDEDSGLFKGIHYSNAVASYNNKEYEVALNELHQETEQNPKHAQAFFLTGKIYEFATFSGEKYFSRITNNYEKYLELKPRGERSSYVKLKIAQHYIREGLKQQNTELLDKAEEYLSSLDQTNNDVKMALGAIYLDKKNYEKAIAAFEESANLSPNELNLKFNSLGLAYIKTGNFSKAEKVLKIAVQINPEDKFAHNNLGFVYINIKKYKEARLQFEEALKIDPNYQNAKNNLQWANSLSKP